MLFRLFSFISVSFFFSLFALQMLVNIKSPEREDSFVLRHAIVVPLRNRDEDAKAFLNHIIKYMNSNFVNDFFFIIFVIQNDDTPFNRGFLFNVGFSEVIRSYNMTSCIISHDVDLVPNSPRIPYGECQYPIQLGSELEDHNWTYPYSENCGGVVSMSVEHWKSINGFSNMYNGWGGEDDDLYLRLKMKNLLKGASGKEILRPKQGNGIFNHIEKALNSNNDTDVFKQNHSFYKRNVNLLDKMLRGRKRNWIYDGIRSLKYKILERKVIFFENSQVISLTILRVIR
jgi:hypothetical protein